MVKHLTIKNWNISFVFRHKFEKDRGCKQRKCMKKEYSLGVYYRRHQTLEKTDCKSAEEWRNNFVSVYVFGVDLILCKMYMSIRKDNLETVKE